MPWTLQKEKTTNQNSGSKTSFSAANWFLFSVLKAIIWGNKEIDISYDPDNHDGVITHLEPDILEWEVKWALESIMVNKAGGGDGISAELFQILNDAVKVLHSICQQIWKTQQWPQDWKWAVFIPIPKKGNAKECSNYCTIALTSHAHKACIYIFISSLPCDCSTLNIKNYFISMILNEKHIVLFSGNFF